MRASSQQDSCINLTYLTYIKMYFNSEIKNMLIVKSYNQIIVYTNCTFRIISLCQVSSHLPWYRPIQETTNIIMVTTGTTEIYERANWIPSTKTYRTERESGAQSNESNSDCRWNSTFRSHCICVLFHCEWEWMGGGWALPSTVFIPAASIWIIDYKPKPAFALQVSSNTLVRSRKCAGKDIVYISLPKYDVLKPLSVK